MLVLDATVVINFGSFGTFDVPYQSVDRRLVVVEEVISEVRQPPASMWLQHALATGRIDRHRLSSDDEFNWVIELQQGRGRLDVGEVASLAACIVHGWALAPDDADARRRARSVGETQPIQVTGTIGLLLSGFWRGNLDLASAEALFQQMPAEGFRAPVQRLADLLES